MDTTLALVDLAGAIALLIWGVHMVQNRDHARFWPTASARAWLCASQPFQSLPGWAGRNLDTPEQHGYRTDGHGIHRRRAYRPNACLGCDAGCQCRQRTSRNAVLTEVGTDLLAEARPALDRLAAVSQRLQNRAPPAGVVRVSALLQITAFWARAIPG